MPACVYQMPFVAIAHQAGLPKSRAMTARIPDAQRELEPAPINGRFTVPYDVVLILQVDYR